jgi:hypothetical protein
MTMTKKPADPAQVLAAAMIAASQAHGGLNEGLTDHAPEVAGALIAAIRANTKPGAELRTALGVELTGPTRMGKNLKAAMDAYTRP